MSGNSEKLKRVFTEVLMVCGGLKLIGGEQFAIEGNGCRQTPHRKRSFRRVEREKYEALAARLIKRHTDNDKRKTKAEQTGEAEAVKN